MGDSSLQLRRTLISSSSLRSFSSCAARRDSHSLRGPAVWRELPQGGQAEVDLLVAGVEDFLGAFEFRLHDAAGFGLKAQDFFRTARAGALFSGFGGGALLAEFFLEPRQLEAHEPRLHGAQLVDQPKEVRNASALEPRGIGSGSRHRCRPHQKCPSPGNPPH